MFPKLRRQISEAVFATRRDLPSDERIIPRALDAVHQAASLKDLQLAENRELPWNSPAADFEVDVSGVPLAPAPRDRTEEKQLTLDQQVIHPREA